MQDGLLVELPVMREPIRIALHDISITAFAYDLKNLPNLPNLPPGRRDYRKPSSAAEGRRTKG